MYLPSVEFSDSANSSSCCEGLVSLDVLAGEVGGGAGGFSISASISSLTVSNSVIKKPKMHLCSEHYSRIRVLSFI